MKLFIIFISVLFLAGCTNNPVKNFAPPTEQTKNERNPMTNNGEPPRQEKSPEKEHEPEPKTEVLGEFSTKLLDASKPRLRNIDIANKALNETTVYSGDVFSFNDTVGRRTTDKGYMKAPIIIEHEKEMGIGGGICQISSTLYNAALDAGLEIVERHQHSAEVGYVKLGQDAAVSYGSLDLKFKNNTPYPIHFQSGVGAQSIDIKILTVK